MKSKILICDSPQIGKKTHTINVVLGYLFSLHRAKDNEVEVFLPYTKRWKEQILSIDLKSFDTIFLSLKWWQDLAGAFKLLKIFKKSNVLEKVVIGGHTAVIFASDILKRFPGVTIWNSLKGDPRFIFPNNLTLHLDIHKIGLATGYIPLREGCSDKCYFCGALPPPPKCVQWVRSAISISSDIEILSKEKTLEIFFDSDAEDLLVKALRLLNKKYENKAYFFFWRNPNYRVIEELLRVFSDVKICLDIVTLDDDARKLLEKQQLLKTTPDLEVLINYIFDIYRKYYVNIDVSFAVGHPLENRDRVMKNLEKIVNIYRKINWHGEIKVTPLHILPNTSFDKLATSYVPKWKKLN